MKYFLFFIIVSIATFASAQSSVSWNTPMNIASNSFSNQHPRMSLDGKGNPMVIWGNYTDQSVYFSRWTGGTFSVPVRINPNWMTVATAGWMGPDISSKGDTAYIVVKRAPEVSNTNRIFVFSSFDGGISFNDPVELAFIGDSISRFPTIEVDATGNPIVAYMKLNANFQESRWVVTKSMDFGTTFSTDVQASGWGNSNEVCDCCPGALISSGNTVAMVYRDNNKNIRDSWAAISTDNGSTFTSGIEVDLNNWTIMSCPSSGPDGVLIGDTLYSTFMSGGSGNLRTYLSKSSISSGAITTMSNLTSTIPGLGSQNYPRIATDGKAMATVWVQSVNNESQLPLAFTQDMPGGIPTTYEIVDKDNITNADVAMSNGNIFVVWQDDGSGTVKFRSGSYEQISANPSVQKESQIAIIPNPAYSTITLQSDEDFQHADIKIVNILGETVFTAPNLNNPNIDISTLPNGTFILFIRLKNKLFTHKFIKQ